MQFLRSLLILAEWNLIAHKMENNYSKITALIVDDEAKSRSILNKLLTDFCPEVEVTGFADSVNEAYKLFIEKKPQLLFLDVEMPHGSGFDLLHRLPNLNFEVIFVTGFDHYALKAIKFHALDYLLKPVDIDELIQSVKKAQEAIQKARDTERIRQLISNLSNPDPGTQQIAIPTNEGREFIPVEQIIYCAADGGYTIIYLQNNRKLISSRNLGEYEKLLPPASESQKHRFYRIHYGQLVNLFYIKKYNSKENYVRMSNGDQINIAQRRKAKFLELVEG